MLKNVTGNIDEKLKSVCLYKRKAGEEEKLINRIMM
jgi:hypothetical protein